MNENFAAINSELSSMTNGLNIKRFLTFDALIVVIVAFFVLKGFLGM